MMQIDEVAYALVRLEAEGRFVNDDEIERLLTEEGGVNFETTRILVCLVGEAIRGWAEAINAQPGVVVRQLLPDADRQD